MTFKNPIFTGLFIYFITKCLIIFIIFFFIVILREQLNKIFQDYHYRIKYFYMNWIAILLYLIGYFGVILWLRIKYINTDMDLKIYLQKIKELYNNNNLFDFITNITIFLLLLLSLIYVIRIVHQFFLTQFTKRFLILNVKEVTELYMDFNKYLLLFRLQSYIQRVISFLLDLLFASVKKDKYSTLHQILWHKFCKMIRFIIMTLPTVILYAWVLYDILFNNLILSSSLYKYLLFYFIYITYKKIHLFISNTDLTLNNILYRMYYLERSYWYVNIPQEYQDVISRYLNLGLCRDMNKNPEPLLDEIIGDYSWFMETECCAHSKDGRIYSIGQRAFIEEDNDREDIIIDYTFIKRLPRKIKNNLNNLSLYIITLVFIIEIIILIILKNIKNVILFKISLIISNFLSMLLPMIVLLYSLIVLINISQMEKEKST